MNIKQAIEQISIKDLTESTGRQPTHANTAKGEYTYNAPYRDDIDPSFKINVHTGKFIDYGQDDAKGDVIQLARLIMGHGNANAVTVSEALQWLKRFSGREVAPTAAKPVQSQARVSVASFEGDRYKLVKAEPISKKTHPNNLAYVNDVRKIGLPVASRYLKIITYKDTAAPADDRMNGYRYGIGSQNDSGGYEVRAMSLHSNFKTSIGPKDVSSFSGHPRATTGDIFEGRFDFLTRLEIAGETTNYNPTVVLNSGRLAARAAQTIRNREDWQHIRHWRIWQHHDDEGDRTTQALIEELGDGYSVGTMQHLYDGFNDLNECWTNAEPQRRAALTALIGAHRAPEQSNSQPKSARPDTELKPK